MKRKHSGSLRGRILQYAALGLIVVCVVSAGLLLLDAWEKRQGQFDGGEQGTLQEVLEYNGTEYVIRDQLETMLFLGLDTYDGDTLDSYNNNKQADFLLLIVVDNENSSYTALQINRDTMTDITELGIANQPIGTVNAQLALSHTYGSGGIDSCLNTVDAVSNFLYGTKIDHYLSVTMDAVPLVNDAVGGVTLVVEEDFSAVDPSLKQGEKVTLKGAQALTYVRSRKEVGDNTNIGRMERQKQYLAALYEQMQKKLEEDSSFMLKLLTDLSPYMVSDYSISQVSGQLDSGLEYELGQFHSIAGESVKGVEFMEFYADDEALKEQLVELLYEEVEN